MRPYGPTNKVHKKAAKKHLSGKAEYLSPPVEWIGRLRSANSAAAAFSSRPLDERRLSVQVELPRNVVPIDKPAKFPAEPVVVHWHQHLTPVRKLVGTRTRS
jgi:hypothetical protein